MLCVGPSVGTWLLAHPIIPFFCLLLNLFSIALHTRLSPSHPLVLEVSHCICSQHVDLMGIHLFPLWAWWGEDGFTWCCVRCFCGHCKRCEISYFARTNPCPHAPCLTIFASLNRHCVINRCCLHIAKFCHCQSHSSWFSVASYTFLRGYDNSCSSSEKSSLQRLAPVEHVFFI